MCMPLARKIGLAMAGTALVFFLFATAIDIGVVRTFGSPEPTKRVLKDSGIYNSIVSSSRDQAKEISGSSSEIPLGNQAVQDAAISIFDAQFLQTTSNNVIDSVYRWLDGRTPVHDFKSDLTAKKAEFADKVAAAAKDRAATLPRCPTAATGNIDAFNAACLPPGVTPEQVAATVHNDIMTGTGFLENPVLTA